MIPSDPYVYPGTNVLQNKAGIHDKDRLAQFEYRKTGERWLELQENPIRGKFDLKHLQKIHKYLFQDVYVWAGKIRTVEIAKGAALFAHPSMIESYAKLTVFKDLAKDELLVGLDKGIFVKRLAHHYSEINALHPFREGNGRSTRQFIEQLASHAGYLLDYAKVDPKRWNDAARLSFSGEMDLLEEILATITRCSSP